MRRRAASSPPMSFEPATPEPPALPVRFAGVDEAGRGPLAGPVVVAAVVFPPGRTPINGLNDSKQLLPERRAELYDRIIERAIAFKIVSIAVEDIDRLNIFHATMLGMRMAVEGVL